MYVRLATIPQILAVGLSFQTAHQLIARMMVSAGKKDAASMLRSPQAV